MNLIQISEPGNKAIGGNGKSEYVIGIDFGTTNSLVSIVEEGKPKIIGDILPSIVSFDNGNIEVGTRKEGVLHVSSIKRLMGVSVEEAVESAKTLAFEVCDVNGDDVPRVVIGDKRLTPIEISAQILAKLKSRAEEYVKGKIGKAVITVPAYFDEGARAATKDAARLAGLEVLRLINEPTSAALAYGLDNADEGIYLVYDFGGGTFDISILNMRMGVFQVLGTSGDTRLGGDNIDHVLSLELFGSEDHEDILAARKIKEELTIKGQVEFSYLGIKGSITRSKFNNIIKNVVARTTNMVDELLRFKDIDIGKIKGVILVGGSTKIPYIKEKLQQIFDQKIFVNIDPERVVVMGASIQADNLVNTKSTLLLDVTPLSLGVEVMGGMVDKIIMRNTAIPTIVKKEFTTYEDGQTGMKFHVVQGEREMAVDCRSLAKFELSNIPSMKAGLARVEVEFCVDADGLLKVSAIELTTGTKQCVEVKPSYGLKQVQLKKMLMDSMKHGGEDVVKKLLAETKTDAKQVLNILTKSIEEDTDLLSEVARAEISSKMNLLKESLKGNNRDSIKENLNDLENVSQQFALDKVNKHLTKGLKGHDVNMVEKIFSKDD
jgi:molecular chaperone HscA